MKSFRVALSGLALASIMISSAFAETPHNIVRIMAPIAQGSPWVASAIEYGDWTNAGSATGCTFSPLAADVEQGAGFVQTATGCTQHQTRTVIQKETNRRTGEVRVVSSQVGERDLSGYTFTRQMVGEKAPAYQCGTRDGSNYWNEYYSVQGAPLGQIITYNGTALRNNVNVSGAPIVASIVDPASGKTVTRGGLVDLSQSNGINIAAYGVCHSN